MSDQSQGPGWWMASDGKWYPPESAPAPPPPPSAPATPVAAFEPITVKGVNGTVTFDGHWVSIARQGAMAKMTVGGGTKQIPINQISGVQLKAPGMTTRGYIQFTIPGGDERRSKGSIGGGATAAAGDENSVLFNKKQASEFEALQKAIMRAIASR